MLPAPASSGSLRQKVLWAGLLLATVWIYGGGYLTALGSHTRVGDFFQEWASARNYYEGLPIYTPQEITAWRYLQYRPGDSPLAVFCRINGHPPPSVLLGLPFAGLPYAPAFLLWNALSLVGLAAALVVVVRRELGTVETWRWLTVLALVISNSLLQHLMLGQLGIWMLVLIVAAAWAEDADRPAWAGALIGTATALKMFPGLLFLYFLVHRRWRALFAGAAACGAWHLAALGLFGARTYSDWIHYSLPEVLHYRDWWGNYSLSGHWYQLFVGASGQTQVWRYSPTTAQIGSLVSAALVVALCAWALHRGGSGREARRSGFALVVAAMVVCTPIAWDHYFLLLLLPLTRLAVRLPPQSASRALLNISLFTFWLNPLVLARSATPDLSSSLSVAALLGIVSWPFYGLLTVLALCVLQTCCDAEPRPPRRRSTKWEPDVAAPESVAV